MCRRRTFDFAGLANLTTIVIPLSRLTVGEATEATLLARLHAQQLSTGDRAIVRARLTSCSPEDVNEDFDDAATLASVSIDTTSPVPSLLRSSVAVKRAQQLLLELVGSRGNVGPDARVTVSVDLVLKE